MHHEYTVFLHDAKRTFKAKIKAMQLQNFQRLCVMHGSENERYHYVMKSKSNFVMT